MRTVYRYEIPVTDEPTEIIAAIESVLAVDAQAPDVVEMWAEVDPDAYRPATTLFRVIKTGHPIPAGYEWVGTARRVCEVWHLYRYR